MNKHDSAMNLIKVKIPTSAPFIPMVVGDWNLYIDSNMYLHCRKPSLGVLSLNFSSKFRNTPVVRKGVEQPITECFDDGISVTYSLGYIDSHQYRPVIMTLRDYYLSWLKSDTYENVREKEYDDIVNHWLDCDNGGFHFNHIVKPTRNKIDFLSLNGIQSGPVRGKYITTGIIYNQDDIKITVSPCR